MPHRHWRDYHTRCKHGGASCGCRNAYLHLRQRDSQCPACEARAARPTGGAPHRPNA